MTKKKIAHPKRAPKRATKTAQKPDPRIPVLTPEVQAKLEAEDRVLEKLIASVGPNLRHASDLLGEVMAETVNCHTGIERTIREINALLWRVRWELGMPGDGVRGGHGTDEDEDGESAEVAS